MTHKRRAKERQVVKMPEPEAREQDQDLPRDLHALLDQELSCLADKYRVPIVLCDLEGKPRKEAARQLGWSEGTLSGRLARARKMLAHRLARRGLVLSAGLLSAVLSQSAASACVPNGLVVYTAKTATLFAAGEAAGAFSLQVVALAEGVLKAMLVTKLKIVTAVLLVLGIAGAGAGVVANQTATTGQETCELAQLEPAIPPPPLVRQPTDQEPGDPRIDAKDEPKKPAVSGRIDRDQRQKNQEEEGDNDNQDQDQDQDEDHGPKAKKDKDQRNKNERKQ